MRARLSLLAVFGRTRACVRSARTAAEFAAIPRAHQNVVHRRDSPLSALTCFRARTTQEWAGAFCSIRAGFGVGRRRQPAAAAPHSSRRRSTRSGGGNEGGGVCSAGSVMFAADREGHITAAAAMAGAGNRIRGISILSEYHSIIAAPTRMTEERGSPRTTTCCALGFRMKKNDGVSAMTRSVRLSRRGRGRAQFSRTRGNKGNFSGFPFCYDSLFGF